MRDVLQAPPEWFLRAAKGLFPVPDAGLVLIGMRAHGSLIGVSGPVDKRAVVNLKVVVVSHG
jgi:hypothetical protein